MDPRAFGGEYRLRTVDRSPVLLLCLLEVVSLPEGIRAQEALPSRDRGEITTESRLATKLGFEYLLRRRRVSGDFDSEFPVAVNALVGIAFLAGGVTEKSGPPSYTEALRHCTAALLARQDESGYFNDGRSQMYGHGFATLYIAELYGTSGDGQTRLQDALRRAIRVIERSQGQDGGWDYEPLGHQRTGASDTSITVCQTMALRAARNLGIVVDTSVVNAARRYIQRAQNPDGGFRYRAMGGTFRQESSEFPRSAAGVCILYSLGDYSSEAIRRGFEYLRENAWKINLFPYYAQYYCAQAMFQAGGRYWRDYYPRVRDLLIRRQRPDGSWQASARENDVQVTAMALIILQLPQRLLPIFER